MAQYESNYSNYDIIGWYNMSNYSNYDIIAPMALEDDNFANFMLTIFNLHGLWNS